MIYCDHCGLPVSADGEARNADSDVPQYCCAGCRMVAETLDGSSDGRAEGRHTMLLARLFAGVLMAGFVMAFSLAISSGYGFGALQRLEHDISTAHWVLLVPTVPALLLLAPPLLRAAWADLRHLRMTMNVLFTLGTTSAVLVSMVSYVRGTGPVYLETAVMLLALYTLGRYLTVRARDHTTRVLGRLTEDPDTTYRRLAPDPGEVRPSDLRVEDRIRVAAGDVIPVDGTVVEGRSYVDESSVTGESRPTVKASGDEVCAGTTALDGAMIVNATAVGDERRLEQIRQMVRRALRRPPRVAKQTDRILRWLIPGILVLSIGAAAGWWWMVGFSKALYVGLSVILITCPCALGIAIPLSLTVALEQAGRKGILVRSGRALLGLARAEAVAFDKTGTLTHRSPASVTVEASEVVAAAGGAGVSASEVLRRAAAVEQGTQHALATAIVDAARRDGLSLPSVHEVRTHPGAGVVGRVRVGGVPRVGVGNERLLEILDVECPDSVASRARAAVEAGHTALYVVDDGAVIGLISIEETLAPHAAASLSAVREQSTDVRVLTGDRPAAARRLADQVGVPTEAGLSPEEKVERVHGLADEYGPVALVGDGVNDAAALAEADVGIALSSGASVSMEAADVTLYDSDLRLVPWLQHLAGRTDRVIRQNLIWTFGYNAIGLGLAVAGLLHPIAAVGIMTVSSLLVTGNAFRLKAVDPPRGDEGV